MGYLRYRKVFGSCILCTKRRGAMGDHRVGLISGQLRLADGRSIPGRGGWQKFVYALRSLGV